MIVIIQLKLCHSKSHSFSLFPRSFDHPSIPSQEWKHIAGDVNNMSFQQTESFTGRNMILVVVISPTPENSLKVIFTLTNVFVPFS